MRKVVYYYGGVVADFPVPDVVYDAYAARSVAVKAGFGEDLEKARRLLQRLMARFAADDGEASVGPDEIFAATYIWHYFNFTDEDTRIEGDVLVADLDGSDQDITYMPLSEVDLLQE